ncbi:hypothetical protein H1235_12615 [Pseudoxanthomonas sp. NC8]|nr:hypothetical protein H1235_12615 [Pseudoxanthomonas sp. NC8]
MTADLTETLIRLGLIAFLLFVCVRVFMPFAGLVGLAMIMAISLYPLYEWLVRLLGGRRRLAGVVFVVVALLLLGIPMILLAGALAEQVGKLYDAFEHNTLYPFRRPTPGSPTGRSSAGACSRCGARPRPTCRSSCTSTATCCASTRARCCR